MTASTAKDKALPLADITCMWMIIAILWPMLGLTVAHYTAHLWWGALDLCLVVTIIGMVFSVAASVFNIYDDYRGAVRTKKGTAFWIMVILIILVGAAYLLFRHFLPWQEFSFLTIAATAIIAGIGTFVLIVLEDS